MKIIPFGEVEKERLEISKRYKLIELANGIWRLTEKCKKNYDLTSYVYYLQGKVEIPNKVGEVKEIKKILSPNEEIKTTEYQKVLNEIFEM